MPGIESLKKFSDDISQVGDEVAIRQKNGTTLPEVSIPDNVPQEDDSYDFEFGLPEEEKDYELDGEQEEQDLADAMSAEDILASIAAESAAPAVAAEETEILDADVAAMLDNILPPSAPSSPEVEEVNLSDSENTFSDGLPDMEESFTSEDSIADDFTMPTQQDFADAPITSDNLDDDMSFDMPSMDDIPSVDDTPSIEPLEGLSAPQESVETSLDTDMSLPQDSFDDFSSESMSSDFDDGFSSTEESISMGSDDEFDEFGGASDDFALDLGGGFDTSDMEDFDASDTSFTGDFDDANFEIPGFSDADAADSRKAPLGIIKKKEAQDDERTHLTDTEYELFKQNLQTYPLNLRLAIDKVIINDEFTDIAIMEVLFKVVKKVSARKLATHLEKMLNISINVPLNYERRTVEQYEAYKLSIQYQLKNRIIPGAIAALVLGAFVYILFYLSATFIYRPIRAEILYNDGYALIENDLYAQSEIKFNEAMSYQVKKRWFFKYAQAYRDKNQYERARNMYEQLVLRFDYDKDAALEYANMELTDLANYERAAEITRRYVLDHHINDEEAMLLLGDIFLEWATSLPFGQERDERFEQARLQYATLMDLYGQEDLFLSRMLRYFIRTDNLREVLALKSYFFSSRTVNLESPDLVELGGYLLEKRYGYLPPSDEYLRSSIENLREVLELAVEKDVSVPEAHYNFARYFVFTDNHSQAIVALNNSIVNFETAEKKTHERTLKHIDAYRLLGEIYTFQEEYLLAEEGFAKGINLFEQAQHTTGLEGNENVGKLYSDMGDLDYFISGDLAVALENYLHAIENFNDTPSIRYKIGYIQYDNKNYSAALNSFVKTSEEDSSDRNLLLALGNVLSIRDDNSAAASHYERLLAMLNADRDRYGILFPQVRSDHAVIVDLYLKATNNLGVTLSKLADRTGNTALQTEALAHFSESLRAWDALTRNQETMVRLEGSNLAEQNIRYLLYPISEFEPAIYAAIPRTLYGEEAIQQTSLN